MKSSKIRIISLLIISSLVGEPLAFAVQSMTAIPPQFEQTSLELANTPRSEFNSEALASTLIWIRKTLGVSPAQSADIRKSASSVLDAERKPPAKPKDLLKDAVREDIFMQNDGIDFVTTVDVLDRYGVFDLLRRHDGVTLSEIHKKNGGNVGYIRIALRLMEDQGWVIHQAHWLRPNKTRYQLTTRGRIASQRSTLSAYSEMAQFINLRLFSIEAIDGFLVNESVRGPPLQRWVDFARQNFQLRSGPYVSEQEEVRIHVTRQLQGVLCAPIYVGLENLRLLKYMTTQATPYSIAELVKNVHGMVNLDELQSAFDFLVYLGWMEKTEAAYSFSPAGRVAAGLAGAYGVPVSYLPMLSRMDELLFGSPRIVFERDKEGHERHVHRALNVRGSGAAHRAYFEAVKERVKEIFDRPISEQPEYICDMGSGDGTFLAVMYDFILNKTLRGRLIAQDPEKYKLWIIGADFNEISRRSTETTLQKANVPHFRVIFGDINDPGTLKKTIMDLHIGINPHNGLHTNTFLIHNRPFIRPHTFWRLLNIWHPSLMTGSYVSPDPSFASKGYRISNYLIELTLIRFFRDWKPLIAKFGMLAIELHLVPPDTALTHFGKLIATSYHATHLNSAQYIVEVPMYLEGAIKAGLRVAWHQVVPRNLPMGQGAITYTHFTAKDKSTNNRNSFSGDVRQDNGEGYLSRLFHRHFPFQRRTQNPSSMQHRLLQAA